MCVNLPLGESIYARAQKRKKHKVYKKRERAKKSTERVRKMKEKDCVQLKIHRGLRVGNRFATLRGCERASFSLVVERRVAVKWHAQLCGRRNSICGMYILYT